jgi:Tol biopolymer transport system component
MKYRHTPVLFFVLMIGLSLACISTPATGTGDQPGVATIVARTMQALTPVPQGELPGGETPAAPAALLPRSLYFLDKDANGIFQVFRLEPNGKELRQITFEPTDVQDYDVSPVDASLVYISNNQMLWVAADGSGRRMLLDGGPLNYDNMLTNTVQAPRWSPDGGTIAYGHNGLVFLSFSTGASSQMLTNQYNSSDGLTILRESYTPNRYSPDGSRLLIFIGYYEGGTIAVYVPSTGTLVRPSSSGILCCTEQWTPDGSAVYVASSSIGMIEAGLWRMDAATGSITTLLSSNTEGSTYDFAEAPFIGPDGQLYFFFANLGTIPDGHTPLTMVRSAQDGSTGRAPLRPDIFPAVNEVLWAPDASFAIVIQPVSPDVWTGGQALLVYADGRPIVNLLSSAQRLRWGP